MLTFSIPRTAAERIVRLGLACADDSSPISHIAVRITPAQSRWSATNGRILASLLVTITEFTGDAADIILDRDQLIAALKAAMKAAGSTITIKIDDTEARVTAGTASSVVRRISGIFPNVDSVWTKVAGKSWIPALSSLDPAFIAIAQKITGQKQAVLFKSPVDPGLRLERLWASPGSEDYAETVALTALRAAVSAPAYWADHELAILVMPISRSGAEQQLDVSAHAVTLPQPAALAA